MPSVRNGLIYLRQIRITPDHCAMIARVLADALHARGCLDGREVDELEAASRYVEITLMMSATRASMNTCTAGTHECPLTASRASSVLPEGQILVPVAD